MRLRNVFGLNDRFKFQSTHLLRDASLDVTLIVTGSPFQSTHLLRDASAFYYAQCFFNGLFQSTHLLRDASKLDNTYTGVSDISIHASLARCVTPAKNSSKSSSSFQSTHLLRDASRKKGVNGYRKSISIHASLARCVTLCKLNLRHFKYFNPRISCEMRLPPIIARAITDNFNPRISCEMRRRRNLSK